MVIVVFRSANPATVVMSKTMAEREVSWGRVSAVLSVLLFWLPLIGLVAGALAYWLNRQAAGWTRRASQVSLTASVLVHVVLLVLFVIEAMRFS